MNGFDYDASAELYSGTSGRTRQKSLKYQRFPRAADAIRYVMEDMPATALQGFSLDVDDETYVGRAILPLYESPDYPLPRRAKAAQ